LLTKITNAYATYSIKRVKKNLINGPDKREMNLIIVSIAPE